jgi:hypothetical protein
MSLAVWTRSVKYSTRVALIYGLERVKINDLMDDILQMISFIFWRKIGIPTMVYVVHLARFWALNAIYLLRIF